MDTHTTLLVSRHLTEIKGGVAVFRDITELRAMELRFRHMDRLAALGELSSMIAHEIRNPMNTIRGFSDRIRRKLAVMPATGDLAEDARFVVEEVDRLSGIVTEMLDYSRPGRRRPESLTLSELVAESRKMIGGRIEEGGIEFKTDVASDLTISADRQQMKQVFLNLFLNAIAAMERGGMLLVAAAPVGEAVEIHIADAGSGIPADELRRIFDPFFTTKTTGTGLGLAIVKNIVETHGGTISAESAVGVGTTFTLKLPKGAADAPEPKAVAAPDAA